MDCPKCGYHFPSRTTGRFSQNHGIHGFASQIERFMADGTTAREIIEEAAARAGLDHYMNRFGRFVFKHESQWSKPEASRVIDQLKEIAQFLGFHLVEISS